jgi:hypothetical protein
MKTLIRTLLTSAVVVAALAHCDGPTDDGFKRRNSDLGDAGDQPGAPACTDTGKSYVGFADTKLEDKRVNAKIGADRGRMKPYSALKGEYERTIGKAPDSLDGAETSFGKAPDRFASEPHASAIQVFTAFRISFDGCLDYVDTNPDLQAAPTATTADAQCRGLARKFWSRAATDDEAKACANVAMTATAAEPDPKRRWAYVCASLLSSSGFLTY